MLTKDNVLIHIDRISKYGTNPAYLENRNVQEVVSMVVKKHIKLLRIYYDYEEIEMFYNGHFTARSEKTL